jgi:hypothetical protein
MILAATLDLWVLVQKTSNERDGAQVVLWSPRPAVAVISGPGVAVPRVRRIPRIRVFVPRIIAGDRDRTPSDLPEPVQING